MIAEEIFHKAIEIADRSKRSAYLDEACRADPTLRAEVEALCAAHNQAGDFLENPAIDPSVTREASALIEGPGTVIGPYKLLEKIGEGGMAVVYMAEQQRPFHRRVALKIIKLGMDTKQVIARFEAERQALALMDHPNIAKVFDAGTTETGRPYFVMELVRGISITEYCDTNKLDIKERLELFVAICNAVHHAHQKGIIHRDLKPSNIMVTLHDGKPVPKVIDFGIAKATNQRLTEKTIFTRYAELIGTPEYMSPEQAEMSGLDIDTRTDIYSLGVVLYELLTGALPFDGQTLRSAALGEIQRIIREEEPPRPSTRLSALGERARKIAESRSTDATALEKRLRSELEWLPLKALRKDRTRRYRSVSEFADDVENYLRGRPLIAGPESARYRLRKFLWRYRTPVALTSGIAAALVVGFTVITFLYVRVKQAQDHVVSLENQVQTDQRLSTAQRLYAEGSYQAAVAEIENSLLGKNPESKTRLLYAQVLFDVGRRDDAEGQLQPLLGAEPGVAGAAHCLLARIYIGKDPEKSRKHRELADSLTPQTADAFALRAMTADSPDVTIDWLSKAVALDPGHYPTRKARVLAYYAVKDYARMEQESDVLIAMRPRDSLGYALRAIARRNRERFQEAIADHTHAIELCSANLEMPILYAQRCETYEQMGDYRTALQDARRCVEMDPNYRGAYCQEFACLVALGDFDGAKRVYQSTRRWAEYQKLLFDRWIQKHVFDILAAGRPLDLPAGIVGQPPFSAMRDAIDAYRQMEQKARRLLPSVFGTAAWSPDGKKLAYGRSDRHAWIDTPLSSQSEVLSTSTGIEILDLASRESHLLVYSGKDPAWSPDGRYIAFVRCPARWLVLKEELWIVPAAGGEPRRLASGGWPFWSPDSRTVFFRRVADECVYSIRIDDPKAQPERVFPSSSSLPSISPDAKYIALGCGSDFRIIEIASGAVVTGWFSPVPEGWGGVYGFWSPDGREVAVCSTSGVWVLNTREGDARHVFPAVSGDPENLVWSPDRSQLAIWLPSPYEELWIARIDPNRPTYESLQPTVTREDYLRHQVEEAERRASQDPNDADAHLSCAIAQVLLGNHAEAAAALQRYNKDGVSWRVKQRRTDRIRHLRELTRFGETQYLIGQYENALQTLEGAEMLRRGVEGESDPQAIALMAMSHFKLGHKAEAQDCLTQLRGMLAEGRYPRADNWLCEAEELLAQEDSQLHGVWTAIAGGRLEDAASLLQTLEAAQQAGTSHASANLESVRAVLIRAYCSRGKQAVLSTNNYKQAISDYETAAGISEDRPRLFSDLGWLFASCPMVDLRNGPRAISHATRACELTGWKDHQAVSILAAVYARLGDFRMAVKWQEEALALLSSEDRPRWQINYSSRLDLYKAGKVYDGLCPWSASTGELVAWWKLDQAAEGVTADSSANRLDGRLIGGAAIVTDAERGNVLSVRKKGGRVDFGNSPPLNVTDEITVACWLKLAQANYLHNIVCHGWLLRLSGDPGGALFSCAGVSCEAWPGNRARGEIHSDDDLSDGQWHHIAATYDGQYLRLYVDGVLVRQAVAWGHLGVTQERGFIGNDASPEHDCRIDDVRIYSYAISAADVKRLAEGNTPGTNPD